MAQDITITKTYADGTALTEAQLDATKSSIETHIENTLNGVQAFDSILANATAESVTIATGAATITRMYAELNAESGAADDLDTITLTNGKFAFVRAASGDTITLKHGTGNITMDGGSNVTITGNETALVFAAGSQIGVIGYGAAAGGSIGGDTGANDNRLLRADGTGGATLQASAITVDDSGVLSGASIDADTNTLTNIGSSEVDPDLISGQTLITSVDGTNDRLLIWDATDSLLKEVAPDNLPAGVSNKVAVVQRATSTGAITSASWQTVPIDAESASSDPDGLFNIASNQIEFLEAGTYLATITATGTVSSGSGFALFRLRDVDSGTTLAVSSSVMGLATAQTRYTSNFQNPFEVTANTTVEVQVFYTTSGGNATFAPETNPTGASETFHAISVPILKVA